MWKCESCGEKHEDQFESCWKCSGEAQGDIDNYTATENALRFDEELAEKFKCQKCNSIGAEVRRVAVTGTGLSRMLDIQHNEYIGVSCKACGYTDFYNSDILRKGSTI